MKTYLSLVEQKLIKSGAPELEFVAELENRIDEIVTNKDWDKELMRRIEDQSRAKMALKVIDQL